MLRGKSRSSEPAVAVAFDSGLTAHGAPEIGLCRPSVLNTASRDWATPTHQPGQKSGGDQEESRVGAGHLPTHPVSLEPAPADDWGRSDWRSGYLNSSEHPDGYWLPVEGCLPPELAGTYLRNGPGVFELGGQTVAHPYDGHGIVASISFKDSRAFFRSRFVETAEYREEMQQAKFLFPGSFGTGSKGSRLPTFAPKNAANTNIIPWQGGLLAMFESGQPHHLQSHSLRTQGLNLSAGALKAGLPLQTPFSVVDAAAGWLLRKAAHTPGLDERLKLRGDALCSHCCTDASTGHTVFLRYRMKLQRYSGDLPQQQGPGGKPKQSCGLWLSRLWAWIQLWLSHLLAWIARQIPVLVTCFTFCEFDEKGQLLTECGHTVLGYAFVHDFGLTASYYLLCLNPVRQSMGKLLRGASCVASIQGLPDMPLRMRLVPREQPHTSKLDPAGKASSPCRLSPEAQEVVEMEAPHAFVFHHANAYESPDHQAVVVDSIAYARFPAFFELSGRSYDFFRDIHPATSPISCLWRYTLCLQTRRVTQHLLCPRAAEFPTINPAVSGLKHRYVYVGLALHACQNGPQQALGKIDVNTGHVQSWTRGPRYFVGEPAFVGRGKQAAEDDGWLVAVCYDAAQQRSEAVVLNAQDLAAGPLAVLPLRSILPHGLHGYWHDTYLGPSKGTDGTEQHSL